MGEHESLQGRVVVVTGASQGIGLAIARGFAGHGASVVMAGRTDAPLRDAASTVPGALPVTADVSDPASVTQLFDAVGEVHGRLDVLVNNAGVAFPSIIGEADIREIQEQIDTNVLGSVLCTRAAVPLMRKAGSGDIVFISSEASKIHFPHLSLYSTTKAGIESFAAAIRDELRDDEIRPMVLIAGHVQTDFRRSWDPQREAAQLAALESSGVGRITGHQPLDPEEVAEAVRFLVTRPRSQLVDILQIRAFR